MSYVMRAARRPSTDRNGHSFGLAVLRAVWAKGRLVPGYEAQADMYRLDTCGALMQWTSYGDTTPRGYGWEVDHITAVDNGGSDNFANLQPLQWQNNRAKGNNPPGAWACAVRWK